MSRLRPIEFSFAALIFLFFFAFPGTRIFALGPQELSRVTFVNETGYTLRYLFASPSDSHLWGPDLLGTKALPFGQSASYYVHYPTDFAHFDFLALDNDGDAYLISDYRIQDGHDPIVGIDLHAHIGPYPSLTISRVYVTNATTRSFSYVFFSPQDSKSWGFDILNDNTSLEPGDTLTFSVPVSAKPRRFEILALSKDQTLVQREVVMQENKPELYIDLSTADLH